MIGKAIDTTRPGAPRSQPAGEGGVGSTHHRPRAGTQAAQMIAFRRPVGRRSVGETYFVMNAPALCAMARSAALA